MESNGEINSTTAFSQKYDYGSVAESQIAHYFLDKGYCVQPVYEKISHGFKGPTLTCPNGQILVLPDIELKHHQKASVYIECKRKNAFNWCKTLQCWTTGIDKRSFEQYEWVKVMTRHDVWIFFLQEDGIAKDTPNGMKPPSGLYGREIDCLAENISITANNYGKEGMLYWADTKLIKFKTLEDLRKIKISRLEDIKKEKDSRNG